MISSRRLTLRTKLLIGFAGVGLLVAALLLLANTIIRDAETRLEQTLTAQVRPLAQLNRLQSQISRIRVLEVELPRLTDLFAVSDQLELLAAERDAFDRDLSQFIRELKKKKRPEALSLEEYWRRYQADLKEIALYANLMELATVQRISTFESAGRFKSISHTLKQLAESTELSAGGAFDQAVSQHGHQRSLFVTTSVVGLVVLAVWVGFLARSVSGRVSRLRDAAIQLAEGRREHPIAVTGNDELAELGAAFNAMQEKVQAREQSLRASQEELESRVARRTHDLNQANAQLQLEVEERRRAEEQLKMLSQAVEQSPASIMITDVAGRIEYLNQALIDSTGYVRDEVIGCSPLFLDAEYDSAEARQGKWNEIMASQTRQREILNRRRDGSLFWVHMRVSPVFDTRDEIRHYLVVAEDITLRKDQHQKILHQAQYDSLTELPNRMLAMDRLAQAILTAQRTDTGIVLIFLDLDDFKKVNDTLGHQLGDALLVQAATRLKQVARAEDTVARLGGDEFLIIFGGLGSPADAEIMAGKIVGAFESPFTLGQSEVVVTPSLGLAVYPDDGDNSDLLLRNADLAMYDAKESGGNAYRFFNQQAQDNSVSRLAIEHRLRGALQRDEFRLYYQPLIATASGQVVGVEALLRWQSPDYGLLLPDQFVSVIEHTGMIIDIGGWVLHTACAQARMWRDQGWEDFQIGVNVSPRQFRGERLLATVRECLALHDLPSGCLQIEVTEGLLVRNQPEVRAILEALSELGVQLVMDDFGTGYSSLSYLKSFHFDTIKIDREFVRDLATDRDDRELVTAAIRMGKGLGLSVVAEGVETEQQLAFLAEQECDVVQGFLFSEPVPAGEFSARWLMPISWQSKPTGLE